MAIVFRSRLGGGTRARAAPMAGQPISGEMWGANHLSRRRGTQRDAAASHVSSSVSSAGKARSVRRCTKRSVRIYGRRNGPIGLSRFPLAM